MQHLADVVFDGARHITALPELCTRVRFRRSGCRKCLDACHDGVIALDPGPTVRGGCAECGLCVTACPTEALRHAYHGDRQLLDHALSRVAREGSGDAPSTVAIRCDRVAAGDGAAWRIPCIGRLTETVIVGLALSGARRLEIVRGRCAECRFRHGEKALARSVAAARVILSALGHEAFEIQTREHDRAAPDGVTRRAFFARLSGGAGDRTTRLLSEPERPQREAPARPPVDGGAGRQPRRALLIELLTRAGTDGLRAVRSGRGSPWAKVRIDKARCVACQACAALCPSRAIVQRVEGDRAVLSFTGAWCTGCGLCAEACPARAIALDTDAPVAEALSRESVAVATIQLSWCAICGDAIAGEAGDKCATCRKRRLSPA